MYQLTLNISKQAAPAWNRPISQAIFDKIDLLTNPLLSKISNRFKSLFSFSYLANATTVSTAVPQAFTFNTMTFDLTSEPTKARQLKSLLDQLCTIPAIISLIQHAFQGENFQVVFADRTELFSEGECHYHRKSIRIAQDQNIYNILSTLLFELCNAANLRLSTILIQDYENADDYALAMEQAEYDTYQQHIGLLQLLQNSKDFTTQLSRVGEDPRNFSLEINNGYHSFAEYWEGANRLQQKAYSHSEYYRRHYSSQTLLTQFMNCRPKQPHAELAQVFSSNTARELLATISGSPNVLTVFNRYQKPLAACLAHHVTAHSLQRFKTLNVASQAYFLQEYAKRYYPLLANAATATAIHKYKPSA